MNATTEERDRAGADDGGSEVLAVFPFRNKRSGALEQVRITTSSFNGRQYTHVRTYWQAVKASGDDDGWRPTKEGCMLREDNIDAAIDALTRVREIIHSEGRSTAPALPGHRNPTPRQLASGKHKDQAEANRTAGDGPTDRVAASRPTRSYRDADQHMRGRS